MIIYKLVIILHLLGAAIWVGGHLLLCIRYLPEAMRKKDVALITHYEAHYESLGVPALFLQILTGIWLAFFHYKLTFMSFKGGLQQTISIKLILLFITLILAVHARLFIVNKLDEKKLPLLALHIIAITIIGVTMLIFGAFFRTGGI